jgi:ABC-2 type transport system permease protein
MLWYKAWLETRVRFLICLFGITALCAYNVFRMDSGLTSEVTPAWYYSVLHGADSQLSIFWLMAVNLLTMGGLLREKSVGAASFTLALPVARARLTCVRLAVSLAQAMALIVVPWAAMFATGSLAGKTHSLSQALYHVVLLAGGGILLYAIAFLVSSLVEGEYTAPMVSAGLVIMIAFQLESPGFSAYNPVAFMMGEGRYDAHAGLLRGPVPWAQFAVYGLLALCCAVASVRALRNRDF